MRAPGGRVGRLDGEHAVPGGGRSGPDHLRRRRRSRRQGLRERQPLQQRRGGRSRQPALRHGRRRHVAERRSGPRPQRASGTAAGTPETARRRARAAAASRSSGDSPATSRGSRSPSPAVACTGSGTSCREVPDVSADADILTGYSIYYNRRWSIFGGTSAAAPTWAALAALANASVACTGKTVGFANPALYQAARSDYGTYFNDVTSGNNSYGGLSGFSCRDRLRHGLGAGLAQGRGRRRRPVRLHLDPAGSAARRPLPPRAAPAGRHADPPGGAAARVGQPVRLALHATDSAGQALTYRATGLPAGLSVAASTGPDHRQPQPRRARPAPPSPSPTRRARPRRRPSPGPSPAGRRSPAGSASTPRAARRCR